MSDSMILSITTSPPPAQTAKPAASTKQVDSSFEDVLRAQSNVLESKPDQVENQVKEQAAPTSTAEAAKPKQPTEKVEKKGDQIEDTEEKIDEQPKAEELQEAITGSSLAGIANIETPIQIQVVNSAEIQPEGELQVAPTTAVTGAQINVADIQANQVSASVPMQAEQVKATEGTPAASTEAAKESIKVIPPEGNSSISAEEATITEVKAQTDVEKNQPGKSAQSNSPANIKTDPGNEAEVKPVEAVQPQTETAQTSSEKMDSKARSSTSQPSTQAASLAEAETDPIKAAAVQTGKAKTTTVSLEEELPKQVQAPPGSSPTDVAGTVIKTTATTTANQIIEPARLAEAQTTDIIGQIARQMEGFSQNGRTTFRIQLSPQDLGQIDLKITSSQQGVGVTIVADNANTSKLLETQVAQLRQSLIDAGVQISNLHVGTQASQQQSNGSQSSYQKKHSSSYSGTPHGMEADDIQVIKTGNSLVDYRI